MGIASIMADGLGLMIGSLLVAGLLTFSAWWLADRAHRPWVAPVMLAAVVAGMLVSPLAASLFVRMVSVFGLVGAGLLWFVGQGAASQPVERDAAAGLTFHAEP